MSLTLRAASLLMALLLAACAPIQMRGVNLVQSRSVALDDLHNVENMQHLKELGANTVAFIPFIRQTDSRSCELSLDEHYPISRLHRAIDLAHQAGLHVVLKPQLLLPGSWAGEIDPGSEAGWTCWFAAYGRQLTELASVAEATHSEMLVVGTELSKTETRAEWRELVGTIRTLYRGKLSYVAHDLHMLSAFAALEQMDSVGITYYPKLEAGDLRQQTRSLAEQVKTEAGKLHKPFWIAEIGITSRSGALADPWAWPEQYGKDTVADPALQAEVLDAWMADLAGDWHQGMLIWNWSSDPHAGGLNDTDFTIQNKPATAKVSCHWRQHCH